MRLTIVQYAGDYRETWERLEGGGKATYQAQRYSIAFVAGLAAKLEQVAVISAVTEIAYDVVLPNGVRAIGAGLKPGFRPRSMVRVLENTSPDMLVLVTPLVPLLRWAHRNRVRTITTLADSFQAKKFRQAIRNRRLARALNRPHVEWVGNHGIAACLSLISIGVRPDKVIPWDWPASHTPSEYLARAIDRAELLRLVYVGSVTEEKGVGDLLRALQRLKLEGLKPELTIIGRDVDDRMQSLAEQLGLMPQVRFAGVIPNEDVPHVMRDAHIVIIPSRHEYPEGLPLTIYEALSARTPIIASDHPMFRGALTDGVSALIFPASDSGALAKAIHQLATDPALYAALSRNSETAWEALQLPVTWGTLVENWLSNTLADRVWIERHAIASGAYEKQIDALNK
jgi:glycosyltransferase involved in cell wall biosynthesis